MKRPFHSAARRLVGLMLMGGLSVAACAPLVAPVGQGGVPPADVPSPTLLDLSGPQAIAQPSGGFGVRRLLFAADLEAQTALYALDSASLQAERLTDLRFRASWPAQSPDGNRLAYAADPNGDYDLFVARYDGSNALNLTAAGGGAGAWDTAPTWSPDGTRLAFVSDRNGDNDLFVLDSTSGEAWPLVVSPAAETWPSWSPTGGWIAYQHKADSAQPDLYLIRADGSDARPLVSDATLESAPAWSPPFIH
jgi:Tol biopolymer transport system component